MSSSLETVWLDPNPNVISRRYVLATDDEDAERQAREIVAPKGAIGCRIFNLMGRPVALFSLVIE